MLHIDKDGERVSLGRCADATVGSENPLSAPQHTNHYHLLINLMSQTDLTQNSTPEESPQNNESRRTASRRRDGMAKKAGTADAKPVAFGEISDLQNATENLTGNFPEGRPERKAENRPERRSERPKDEAEAASTKTEEASTEAEEASTKTVEASTGAKEESPKPMRSAPRFEEKESKKENWAPSRQDADRKNKKRVRRETASQSKGLFARLSAMISGLFAPPKPAEEERAQPRKRRPSSRDGDGSDRRRRSGGKRRSRGQRGGRHRSSQGSSKNRDNSDS